MNCCLRNEFIQNLATFFSYFNFKSAFFFSFFVYFKSYSNANPQMA